MSGVRRALPDGVLLRHPLVRHAQRLALVHLADQGTRHAHVSTAGHVARQVAVLFDLEDAALLVAAATVHDIGYAPAIARTGFHPFDGAVLLRDEGFPPRLVSLVAHHSLAVLTPGAERVLDRYHAFPPEDGLLADALAYADMHSAPDGRVIQVERRLADIAQRHDHPDVAQRARLLRAATARVGAALLAVGSVGGPVGGGGARGRAPLGPSPGRDLVHAAFDTWWAAEAAYAEALAGYEPGEGAHDAAVRLAGLRSRADRGRDHYFRRALATGAGRK